MVQNGVTLQRVAPACAGARGDASSFPLRFQCRPRVRGGPGKERGPDFDKRVAPVCAGGRLGRLVLPVYDSDRPSVLGGPDRAKLPGTSAETSPPRAREPGLRATKRRKSNTSPSRARGPELLREQSVGRWVAPMRRAGLRKTLKSPASRLRGNNDESSRVLPLRCCLKLTVYEPCRIISAESAFLSREIPDSSGRK